MTLAEKIRHLPVAREKAKGRRGLMADPWEEMDRMFDRFLGRSMMRGWARPRWWPLEAPLGDAELPRVDVVDHDDEVVIRAEMPGVGKDDLEITLGDDTITLRGTIKEEHEEKEGDYYYRETGHGEFARTVGLPAKVDGSKAEATFEKGIVRVLLPKMSTATRQKIEIK